MASGVVFDLHRRESDVEERDQHRRGAVRRQRELLVMRVGRRLPMTATPEIAPKTGRQAESPVAGARPDFERALAERAIAPLARARVTTLQVNVGKLCNMACHHCHVDAGPKRTEVMPRAVAERVIALLAGSPSVEVVDITGGAPELNPNFRWLVTESRRHGRRVIDRCNLTVLFEQGMEGLASFLAEHQVAIVASLPCYSDENVDRQRGRGAFDKSIHALQRLNGLGYGKPGSGLTLDLVYNPTGPFLPPPQAGLEATYREELGRRFGVAFNHLLTITNMPIHRFWHAASRDGKAASYMGLLVESFNPTTVDGVMCRSLVSVGWDGRLYDCDFNQMLELPLPGPRTIWDVEDVSELARRPIATGPHCFGCTAGAGSSCSGALA
jgi:radical SAM/Cys-rich protein